jgi:predicted nucleic acid-binding protein
MIIVDASVWISFLVQEDGRHAISHRWLTQTLIRGPDIAAPMILLAEVGGAIARRTGTPDLGNKSIDRLLAIPKLRLVAVDHSLGMRAARIAAERRLRGADAIYVAVAAYLNIPLVTWDRQQLDRAAAIVRSSSPGEML